MNTFCFCSWLLMFSAGLCASGCDRDGAGAALPETQLATSATHSCALRDAHLFCWGENFRGQLGTGDLVDSEKAVSASVAGADIAQVALSSGRSCVRRKSGEVACWGANEVGQIGNGLRTDSLTAVNAIGVNDASLLALDDETTCVARGPERRVACWGASPEADPTQGSLEPVAIADVAGVVELRAGVLGQYCARVQGESVRCWSLKEGAWTAAKEVPALAGARNLAMTAPSEVCAIVGKGPIQCHNLDSGITVPLDDSAGHVRIIGAGSLSTCAVNREGEWHCWNVLPPMLETVGSPRLDARADEPYRDLILSGFRICVVLEDDAVACGMVEEWSFPKLTRIAGLP